VQEGAIPADELTDVFPSLDLPIKPPFPPQDTKSVAAIPAGPGWFYEQKFDGFRCLAFRRGKQVVLQSKAGQPLGRYFPEVVKAVQELPRDGFLLDGEIVIFRGEHLSFDDLLMRIHPAESRIRKLSVETPAVLICFDLVVEDALSLTDLAFQKRRAKLENFFRDLSDEGMIRISTGSTDLDQAHSWMEELGNIGLDGVVAKRLDEPYRSGERTTMVKIKRLRTADCVVGGFRYAEKGGGIGSLLLGLFNNEGLLDHVGFTSSFNAEQRGELKKIVERQIGAPGFSGKAPGGPSRWSTKRSTEWQPLKNKLVCEVQYDHFSGGRFRHGTKFLRWRPDKKPSQCTFDQVQPTRKMNTPPVNVNEGAAAAKSDGRGSKTKVA
jgi:ATP-dependent DNA ligase